MSPRLPIVQARSVLLVGLALVTGFPAVEASSRLGVSANGPEGGSNPSSTRVAAGLLTDRLSPRQELRWRPIVGLVLAEDDRGRPLHATLRAMWDELATSGHQVYVELAAPSLSQRNAAGLFLIESIGLDGGIVAVLRLDLQAIDRAREGDTTDSGFPRFRGLAREARYAEVLGHELGHAVWTLADTARAHRLLALQDRLVEVTRQLLRAKGDERTEIRRRLRGLSEELEAFEPPAWAAEARVWEELTASHTKAARWLVEP